MCRWYKAKFLYLILKYALANKNDLLLSRYIMKDDYVGGELQAQNRSEQQGGQGRIEIPFFN